MSSASTLTQTAPTPKKMFRNRPGIRLEEFYEYYPDFSIEDMDSTFSVQMYLQALIRKHKDDVEKIVQLPDGQDPLVWQYEQLRQICLELNYLVSALQDECTNTSCPEMKANEWQYLCAAHPTPQACPAIDYTVHTLDGCGAILNSNKYFPSRISVPDSSKSQFQNMTRRLYRIFAHAFFHHRQIFDEFENDTALYGRFLELSMQYQLIPSDLIIIPTTSDGGDIVRNIKDAPVTAIDTD
ncbi:MOB kinase activator-like 4-like protein [Paraphysoderma sedebokerense]|nr:MOB kinase activator-like 4-like protein [Paraphysoderma sedebokerense]